MIITNEKVKFAVVGAGHIGFIWANLLGVWFTFFVANFHLKIVLRV